MSFMTVERCWLPSTTSSAIIASTSTVVLITITLSESSLETSYSCHAALRFGLSKVEGGVSSQELAYAAAMQDVVAYNKRPPSHLTEV
jgi:hypothetical protein